MPTPAPAPVPLYVPYTHRCALSSLPQLFLVQLSSRGINGFINPILGNTNIRYHSGAYPTSTTGTCPSIRPLSTPVCPQRSTPQLFLVQQSTHRTNGLIHPILGHNNISNHRGGHATPTNGTCRSIRPLHTPVCPQRSTPQFFLVQLSS